MGMTAYLAGLGLALGLLTAWGADRMAGRRLRPGQRRALYAALMLLAPLALEALFFLLLPCQGGLVP